MLFIGIEQPDRTKEIYTFVFDFEINGVDYHDRHTLTSELFETFEYKKEKHGRWVEGKSLEKCSVCGKKGFPDWHYCPNCGAKMDKEAT